MKTMDRTQIAELVQKAQAGDGEAMGLAFSVPKGVKVPPSLRNIYKEIAAEYGVGAPTAGDLSHWADQGVLLMNAILTVRKDTAASHRGWGWETLTDRWLSALSRERKGLVFLLWGRFAQEKAGLIGPGHEILTANHPSPLSARRPPVPFLGCGHFRKVNEILRAQGETPIEWFPEGQRA